MRRVLACGLATVDVVQAVDRVPGANEKVVARGTRIEAGGPALNAAVTATLLGMPAALVTAVVATKVIRARRAPTKTGREEMVGEIGVVRSAVAPAGLVNVHGEIWKAHTGGEPLAVGEYVRVETVGEDLVLEVAPAEEPAPVAASS